MKPVSVIALPLLAILGALGCGPAETPTGTQPGPETQGDSERFTVYYGLNESHSRDWAQVNDDGLVGITYFERSGSGTAEGTLLYKTIRRDGLEAIESVATGTRLEMSVLLYDALSNPHIFVATSDASDQRVDHHFKEGDGPWRSETIVHFNGEGGRAIYELSADTGPDFSFHLLILKTRDVVDSPDFNDAWMDSNLYHLTNATGSWEKELIHHYDMAYTYDWYIKSSSRQDIAVDDLGHVHVVFGEQIAGVPDPSRLRYATNATGRWVIETALDPTAGTTDDAGWFPSLSLDNDGVPHISCMYLARVPTHSATSSRLLLLERRGSGNWHSEVVADFDDGYYGGDGRGYTGGLSHLVFDSHNTAHIIFSDLAATHWPGTQRVTVGNIRYGVRENGAWSVSTVYRQPVPTDFFSGREMHGMCLLVSEESNTVRIVGEELVLASERDYSSNLMTFSWQEDIPLGPRTMLLPPT
jgi:hypothetical protein